MFSLIKRNRYFKIVSFALLISLTISLTLAGLPFLPFEPDISRAATVAGAPSGNGADNNPATFKFSEDNSDVKLTKTNNSLIDMDEVPSIYGSSEGMRIYVNGVDVASPAYPGPGGPKAPIPKDLSDSAGWPDIYVPPRTVAIDPNLGRFKFYEKVLGGRYVTGVTLDVFVQDNNYAYVADGGDDGLQIIDVSNPAKPQLASKVTANAGLAVAANGNYAYLATKGLKIFDISNPASPEKIGEFSGANFSEVTVNGTYAYVTGDGGVQIVDVSNPSAPKLSGGYSLSGMANEISIQGTQAFLAADDGLHVLDISNPASPKFLGKYLETTSGVFVSGNYAYIAVASGLKVIDISNPASPKLVASLNIAGIASKVFVSENFAYVAAGDAGLQVIDISDPTKPALATTYDTPGSAMGVSVNGSFAYVADHVEGLRVIDLTQAPSESPQGLVTADYNYYVAPSPPPPPPPPSPKTVGRLWGQTSVETAVAICKMGFTNGSKVALVARDDYFTDALAGGPLAKFVSYKYGSSAPILLTNSHQLTDQTRQEIQKLGAETIYLLGGPGAVDDQVKNDLGAIPGVKVVNRLWGLSSYGTAKAIKEEMDSIAAEKGINKPDIAIITTGENFPDSLVISGPAASKNMPILLVKPWTSEPPDETKLALQGLKNIIIVGGPGAVHPFLEDWLNRSGHAVMKGLWGNSEYDTAIDVISSGNSIFNFNQSTTLVTRGDYFTDTLAGGAFASQGPYPMVLVDTGSIPDVTNLWLIGNKSEIQTIYILGGWGAVSDSVLGQITGIVK